MRLSIEQSSYGTARAVWAVYGPLEGQIRARGLEQHLRAQWTPGTHGGACIE